MSDYLVIGKIIGAHGIRGEVKVFPLTDDARRFLDLKEAMLLSDDEKPVNGVRFVSSRIIGKNIACTLEGINDRDAAQLLSGHYLSVERSEAVELPENRYFISDLIGCTVCDDEIGILGLLTEVLQQTGADVFVIAREKKKDLLIPFLKAVVYRVDIENKEIRVRLPDGLFEVYES
ncbi:MAG: 16S rRNA processing protein RimM [Clostridiales bacterium]|nr:16S rRNA processing protein RimM [Clostridiales bacterium]